jgi:hypothetical protein
LLASCWYIAHHWQADFMTRGCPTTFLTSPTCQ